MLYSQFAHRLRTLRKAAKISQINFAQSLKVSQPTIHHWEKGTRRPNKEKLIEISKILDVSLETLHTLLREVADEESSSQEIPDHPQQSSQTKENIIIPTIVDTPFSACDTLTYDSLLPELKDTQSASFQGVPGAYSHQAIMECFPNAKAHACDTFEKALAAVDRGTAELAMIPIENSLFGRVSDIHHLLPNSSLYIVGEYFQPIRHMLLGCEDAELHDIKTVISHPQALGQTRTTLAELKVKRENFFDTAGAAREVASRGDKHLAAVASELSAKIYHLKILRNRIEDKLGNVTRFIIMSPRRIDPPFHPINPPKTITSLMFTTRSIPAALYKCVGGFATQGINIVKLESYVPFFSRQQASFYAEIEGNPRDEHVQQALDELSYYTAQSRVLGVYLASPSRDDMHY